MTYRPTEYQVAKRLLYWHAKEKIISRHEANEIIKTSVEEAYEKLDDNTKQWLQVNMDKLDTEIGKNNRQFSRPMALELLAAMGDWMNGNV